MAVFSLFALHANYKAAEDRAAVELFGRTPDGKQVCVRFADFKPYFYLLPKRGKLASLAEELRTFALLDGQRTVTVEVEKVERALHASREKFLKLTTAMPTDVRLLREALRQRPDVEGIFDADIPYVRRFLIDMDVTPLERCDVEAERIDALYKVPVFLGKSLSAPDAENLSELKALALDLETYSQFGEEIVPQKQPILMASLWGGDFRRAVTWRRFPTTNKDIEFVDDEAALIRRVAQLIEEQGPDALVGYFSDGFDMPYLRERARRLNVPLELGLDRSQLSVKERAGAEARVAGIAHIDIYKFIRRTMFAVMETNEFTLDAVAAELLGERKQAVALDKLTETWDKRPEELEQYCLYNLRDAQLAYLLFVKLQGNLLELVKLVGQGIHDVSRMPYSELVEWHLIREAFLRGRVVPLSPAGDEFSTRRGKTYEGAFVATPKPGLHRDLVVFDFRSLYPSIISAHNISPETLRCGCCHSALVPGDKETWFCQRRKGFIPGVIENLIERRTRVKEVLAKSAESERAVLHARQYALKTVANSMYGYLGFAGARWYSLEAAKSITAYGRYYISDVIASAERAGFTVLYGDTDSIFLSLSGKSREQAASFLEDINKKLPGMMELDLQGFYKAGIFVSTKDDSSGAKKKYALLSESGKVTIKGFESVKRNYAPIAKEVQERVLDIILRENDAEKAFSYVRGVIRDVRQRLVPREKMVIKTVLQKSPGEYVTKMPHTVAAERMRAAGKHIAAGTLVKYIVAQGEGKIRDRVRLPEEFTGNDYDTEYYVEHQVIPVIEKIFEVLGYSRERLTRDQVQGSLGRYM